MKGKLQRMRSFDAKIKSYRTAFLCLFFSLAHKGFGSFFPTLDMFMVLFAETRKKYKNEGAHRKTMPFGGQSARSRMFA